MTAEHFPHDFLRNCTLSMNQQSCRIELQIDLDKNQTIVNVTGSNEYVETSITATETIENGLKHKRYISFWCSDQYGRCNNEYYLQRVLRSMTIEGSFKELEPLLIPTNQTIPRSSCLVLSNTTTIECPSDCSDDNKACYIESLMDVESFEVCARCSSIKDYHLMYSMTFFNNDPSIPQSDDQVLSCALPQCNSFVNLERIGQLVTIDFNAATFFNTSTTTVVSSTTTTVPSTTTTVTSTTTTVPSTTTTTVSTTTTTTASSTTTTTTPSTTTKTTTTTSSGSTLWINDLHKYCTLLIFLTMSFLYNIMLS